LPAAVLAGRDEHLSKRAAALARYAETITARPWSVTVELVGQLADQGLDEGQIEAATGVVVTFNYLTRVADASGIEFDYASPLPEFTPRRDRRAFDRPGRDAWPLVGPPYRSFSQAPMLAGVWDRWLEYVFDADAPLARRERRVLALAAARECCDRWEADRLAEFEPRDDRERRLAGFAVKLSREPWRMQPSDLDGLRALGHPEPAVLHVIAVVALQNAVSRLALARGLAAA